VKIHVIGGGLAGCEAAWQVARRGLDCVLHEMRPVRATPAHQTDGLAELVCSNSLKSESESTAPWLLKEELRRLDSLLLEAARKARVPGGHALTVDRNAFTREVTQAIAGEPRIELRREEVTALTDDAIWIVASGPLTSAKNFSLNQAARRRTSILRPGSAGISRRSNISGPRVSSRNSAMVAAPGIGG